MSESYFGPGYDPTKVLDPLSVGFTNLALNARHGVTKVTTSTFALTANHRGVILVDASLNAITITLPLTTSFSDLQYLFVRNDYSANLVTIQTSGSETIQLSSITKVGLASAENLILVSDNTSRWSGASNRGDLPNLVENPAMSVNQLLTPSAITAGSATANAAVVDRFFMYANPSTASCSITPSYSTIYNDNAPVPGRITGTVTSAGTATSVSIAHRIPVIRRFSKKTLGVRTQVTVSSPVTATLNVYSSSSATIASSTNTLLATVSVALTANSWTTLFTPVQIPDHSQTGLTATDNLLVELVIPVGASVFSTTGWDVRESGYLHRFQHPELGEETIKCQRYYWLSASSSVVSSGTGNGAASLSFPTPITMVSTPTVTVYNPSDNSAGTMRSSGGANITATVSDTGTQYIRVTNSATVVDNTTYSCYIRADAQLR